MLLAGAARSWGHSPSIIDLDAAPMNREELSRSIADAMPAFIVFVVYGQNPNAGTTSMIGATKTASELKKDIPEAQICFIGSHASALPFDVISLPYVDFAFINEGVVGLKVLLQTNFKDNLEKVPGLWFKSSDGQRWTGFVRQRAGKDN